MIDMINGHVLPSTKAAGLDTKELVAGCKKVADGVKGLHAAGSEYEKATLARVLRLETMDAVRNICDKLEAQVPADLWTLATYKELLFLDCNQGATEFVD